MHDTPTFNIASTKFQVPLTTILNNYSKHTCYINHGFYKSSQNACASVLCVHMCVAGRGETGRNVGAG